MNEAEAFGVSCDYPTLGNCSQFKNNGTSVPESLLAFVKPQNLEPRTLQKLRGSFKIVTAIKSSGSQYDPRVLDWEGLYQGVRDYLFS
jgi:hypothetical protein